MTADPSWPNWSLRLAPPPDRSRRLEAGRRLGPGAADGPRPEPPLVSYVTVVRNAAATIERTLRSVQVQTWPRVEHIVVDGLSDDGTLAILQRHASQIDYLVSEADRGLYEALNKAIPLARGDLICVLNADDWLTPDAAALAAGAWQRASRAAGGRSLPPARLLLSAAWAERGDGSSLWSPARLDLGAYFTCANICHNGVYASPAAYQASGPYASNLRIAADFRWLMRCADAGVEVLAIAEPTVHYSMGGLSSDTRGHTQECARILQERFPFLDDTEVWGLMHAFHEYRPHLAPFAASRPAHLGRFLRDVARAHAAADPAFAQALALASTACLQHPEDGTPSLRLTRAEKARRSLTKRWMKLRSRFGG